MIPLLLSLVTISPTWALTTRQNGPWFDAGVGFAAGDAPLAAGIGWQAGAGWWTGRYDDAFAIGRHWAAGLVLRQDWVDGESRTAPMLELRRGVDLLALGWQLFVAGGPLLVSDGFPFDDPEVGATGRVGVGLVWRRTPSLGLTLRLEAGADFWDDQVGAVTAVMLGGRFARPLRRNSD